MASSGLFKNKRAELTQDRRIDIAAMLQLAAMDQIAKIHGDGPGLVFHGGTSIAFLHGSPRWSEDLDFMATPAAMTRIFENEDRLLRFLQLHMSLSTPGGSVTLARKKGEVDLGQVAKLNLRWEHPDLIGAVRIKVEFYITPEERLAAYRASPRLAAFHDHRAAHSIPGADVASLWADKIVAIAQRPALKHRDIHDLGLIAPMLSGQEDLDAALCASMGIYGRSPEEISEGLARPLVAQNIHDRKAFLADMERWFAGKEFKANLEAGTYDTLHQAFLVQFGEGVRRVAGLCSSADCHP